MQINNYTPTFFQPSKADIYKRFKNLSVNEEILPQGDGKIRISPFDDYVLFTLYDEVDGADTPIDLLNVGKLYINFVGENDIIKIPYYDNVYELDLKQGQVLFRISEEDSKKILALDNKNFFISSQMMSKNGDVSDETTLYTGTFLSFSDEAQESMTSKYNKLLDTSTAEVAALEKKVAELKTANAKLQNDIKENLNTIGSLRSSNAELSNSLSDVTSDLTSASLQSAQDNAALVQALADAEAARNALLEQSIGGWTDYVPDSGA
tara:strand:- start:173 stop:967 length:795 start_codon:yes stop_codon:yes gene_type:complete